MPVSLWFFLCLCCAVTCILARQQAFQADDTTVVPPPEGMVLHNLSISGPSMARVNLMFFSDGCASSPSFFPAEPYDVLGSDTPDEEAKFLSDASALTRDIVSESGPMAHVSHLLNVYAVFVPSNTSGIGTYDQPLPGAAFGLYRPGPELRGVYVQEEKRARAACRYWRGKEGEGAGCDQPILLGNDGLYGGLGGEFTVITASEKNGALVLRHELGHSLIDVGEEYEGGYSYFGANSDKVKSLHSLKWSEFLSDPQGIRIEDVKVPFQAYPWHNLTSSSYTVSFNSTSLDPASYPTARLRTSLSSIPFPSHVNLTLNAKSVDLHPAFPDSWAGSLDRRWIEIPLPAGLPPGENTISVELTQEGREAKEGQGGKMITSLEIAEYGGDGRHNKTPGFIGAFPTYAIDGSVTLRPMSDGCLMRQVDHPTFCPVCADALEKRLTKLIARKTGSK